jgi:hypothetical protein
MKLIGISIMAFMFAGFVMNGGFPDNGNAASAVAPLLWLGLGVLLWRKGLKKERERERAAKLGHTNGNNELQTPVRNEQPAH